MEDLLRQIKEKIRSNNLSDQLEAIYNIEEIIIKLTDLAVSVFEKEEGNLFALTERLSMFFSNYINKLNNMLDNDDNETPFWSACLICSYNIRNSEAESILLKEIKEGTGANAQVATTILARNKNWGLKEVLNDKLKDPLINEDDYLFFWEKLRDLSDGKE